MELPQRPVARLLNLVESELGGTGVVSGVAVVGWANAMRSRFVGVRGLDTPTAWRQIYWPKACRMVFRMKRKSRDDRASPISAT
jgi:hypothetical protein